MGPNGETNLPPGAGKKTVKKARRRAVKKTARKVTAGKPEESKLDRLINKSKKTYYDYIQKIELLEQYGADGSTLSGLRGEADIMVDSIASAAELKKFFAVCKKLGVGLGEMQISFTEDMTGALIQSVDSLEEGGLDYSHLKTEIDTIGSSLRNLKINSGELLKALTKINEIRMRIKDEMERAATPPEAEVPLEEVAEKAAAEVGSEGEIGIEPGLESGVEEVGGEVGLTETASELGEPAGVDGSVAEEAESSTSPVDEELQQRSEQMAELVNEAYMTVQKAQAESNLTFSEALNIVERAGDLVGNGEFEGIEEMLQMVPMAVDAEIELRKSIGRKLEKCRKDILLATNQGIVLDDITSLFSEARTMFDSNDFSGAGMAATSIEEQVAKKIEGFNKTVSRIELVKSNINQAREEEIDVSQEMERFKSLKTYMTNGEFERAIEALDHIESSILEKRKAQVSNEITQTTAILEKAPTYIDVTEPLAILSRARSELENDELEKAVESVKESKDLSMSIRERYLALVEKSNSISKDMNELYKLKVDISNMQNLYNSGKEELKNGDFSQCEEHFATTLDVIEDAKKCIFDELSERIVNDLDSCGVLIKEMRDDHPDMDMTDNEDQLSDLRQQYEGSEDVGVLLAVSKELEDLREELVDRKNRYLRTVEEKKRRGLEGEFREKVQRCKMLMKDIGAKVDVEKQMSFLNNGTAQADAGNLEEALSTVNGVYNELVDMKKELDLRVDVSLAGKGFEKGVWGEAKAAIRNLGSFQLSDLTVKLEGPFEIRRSIHFDGLGPQEDATTSVAMMLSGVGRIPVDITVEFVSEPDGKKREKRFARWANADKVAPFELLMDFEDEQREPIAGKKRELTLLKEKKKERAAIRGSGPLDTCPVCRLAVGEPALRYLCGCNQMYHKKCAEKVNNNSCLTCGIALFEVENMMLATCLICKGDVWYNDEIFMHDCGEYYHRDCILREGTCKNCYAPIDNTTGFMCATCMVCHEIVKDDEDYRRCGCGEAYHRNCYGRVNYCVRCGTNINPNVQRKGPVKRSTVSPEAGDGAVRKEPIVHATPEKSIMKPVAAASKPTMKEVPVPVKGPLHAEKDETHRGEEISSRSEETVDSDDTAVVDESSIETPSTETTGGETAANEVSNESDDLDALLDDLEDDLN